MGLLEETPAVLSLGKLCSEHRCDGTKVTCTMDNFVPLVVPGLSLSSSSSSASTSRPKEQSNQQIQRLEVPSMHAWKPMQTNPDEQASESRGSARTEDETDKEDPTQGIPEWLQPFTANPEDLETHVPAHSSEREISDSKGDAS